MADLLVPGYDVVELLGFGSGGEVWLAREHATGASVALKRLRADADIAARDRLRREAAVLAGVDHPHVLRLRSVVGAGESLVLVLDLATGGSLARLLATRGRLSAGEVVTIAVPLAQALAVVHAQGLVHGDVTPANVLFAADGRPVLSDLGVARLLGAPQTDVAGTPGFLDPVLAGGGEPGPAGDVHGLAATCLAALTGHPPYDESGTRIGPSGEDAVLTRVLESALAPDPADRPRADELAAAVFDAAAAVPVQLGHGRVPSDDTATPAAQLLTHRVAGAPAAPADPPPPPRGSRLGAHRAGTAAPARSAPRWRTVLALLLGVTAIAMAGITGVIFTADRDDPEPAQVAAERTADAPARQPAQVESRPPDRSWVEILASLDAARSRAFAVADPARLMEVYAPGAPALRRDRSVVGRLAAAGLRARGLRLSAVEIERIAQDARRVRLRVEDVLSAYRLVDATGTVVESRPGRGRMRWTVTLQVDGERWKVYDVERE